MIEAGDCNAMNLLPPKLSRCGAVAAFLTAGTGGAWLAFQIVRHDHATKDRR